MKIVRTFLLALFLAVPVLAQQQAAAPAAESWTIDKAHSSAQFKVRHLMANVTGRFKDFDAVINLDRAKPAGSSIEFTIQAASVDTNNNNRDEHLRTPDFFDVAKHPAISFKSTAIKERSKDLYDVTGDFTMHGVTKRITIPVQFLGFGRGPGGSEKAGFEINTTINRKDYGVIWNRNLDEGGVLLGDDVKVTINLELNKKKA
jgi:polyisoprenoid-binding protein YceI